MESASTQALIVISKMHQEGRITDEQKESLKGKSNKCSLNAPFRHDLRRGLHSAVFLRRLPGWGGFEERYSQVLPDQLRRCRGRGARQEWTWHGKIKWTLANLVCRQPVQLTAQSTWRRERDWTNCSLRARQRPKCRRELRSTWGWMGATLVHHQLWLRWTWRTQIKTTGETEALCRRQPCSWSRTDCY